MQWEFNLPVKLVFGSGKRSDLAKYIDEIGGTRGVLVCGNSFCKNGVADEFLRLGGGKIVEIFSDIRPNPTTDNVNDCVRLMREVDADFAVALGGGSPMDCCKAACAIVRGDDNIEPYHSLGKSISAKEAIPMIAVTTTSGTASEVTNISVLTDINKNLKQPMNDPAMYPKIAVIDPELTLTVPPQVTASTGLDVLSHAIESYWSTLNQPICSACSIYAARLVFEWLEKAYTEPENLTAREKMAEASIVAGVAFSHPRTTGSHACSFPLTNIYGIPHGEACAFTLDYFVKFNAKHADSDGRLDALAKDCGFDSAYEMADEISAMKKRMGMRSRLSEIGCTSDEQIAELTKKSMSMLMKRNPIELSESDIGEMYNKLK
ncbi:iron-containing alcohol dehydrogenase family protein [Eubacterium sp.]|uniref:iron-containing alcohol dehydrogenase family protein n=1 Tax=Eubacterium sp. TaxID=142586 RepID=UPI0025BC2FA9|nr:iron-containing alcohol dehydrogenase family protein [Eubacterium sp.]MCI7800666.1 iron-containing alcohol dehydrogenase family protein [Eubacterium sp.]